MIGTYVVKEIYVIIVSWEHLQATVFYGGIYEMCLIMRVKRPEELFKGAWHDVLQ